MRKLAFRVPGVADPIAVEFQRADGGSLYVCTAGSSHAEIEFDRLADGGGRMRVQGRVIPFYATKTDSMVEVWLAGKTYTLDIVDTTLRRAVAGRGPVSDEIAAPMPGTILKILVAAGDGFEAHQPLIIMESMKMEMSLSTPLAGCVREVKCAVGELVAMGKVLAKIKAIEGDDTSK